MSKVEDSLTQFASKVRQLIARYSDAKKEIEVLRVAVESRDKEVEKLQKQLAQAHQDYESLKMARMIEVSDGDVEVAKKRIAGLIREVNKCITLLSEQQ